MSEETRKVMGEKMNPRVIKKVQKMIEAEFIVNPQMNVLFASWCNGKITLKLNATPTELLGYFLFLLHQQEGTYEIMDAAMDHYEADRLYDEELKRLQELQTTEA
jgi:hypothetical protein